MKTYSLDMRQHIVDAVNRGIPQVQVARVFGVSSGSVKRYLRQYRETGNVAPKPKLGRPARNRTVLHTALLAQLEAHPDATLEEHCQVLRVKYGIQLSRWTVGREIGRLGWTRKKKTLYAAERDEEAHAAWKLLMQEFDAQKLIFVDECGINLAMTRSYARSPEGQRAVGSIPRKWGPNITLIASLSLNGIGSAMTVKDAADSRVFETYVRSVLAPTLVPEQIVIMDNISIHKGATVRKLIEQQKCHLTFLPAYPEGLVPIDEAFSKIKGLLRKAEARTVDVLDDVLGTVLDSITPKDAFGYFKHCGYIQ